MLKMVRKGVSICEREVVRMAGPWLYGIAAAAGKVFNLEGRKEPIPVTVDTYRALVRSGRLTKDPWWYIRQNWKKVDVGDELFVYTGDQDLGIIGYAKIDLKERSDAWYVHLDFDLRKCRTLLECPIPAVIVRQWVPFPRRNVISLAPFERQLYARLPWKKGRSATAK
jgi:hypothetical protein